MLPFRRFSHSKRIPAAVVRSVGLEVADKRDEAAQNNEKFTLEVDGPIMRPRRSAGGVLRPWRPSAPFEGAAIFLKKIEMPFLQRFQTRSAHWRAV